MKQCIRCRSWAINHHAHDRDGSDGDLCDVCYWRKRAETKDEDGEALRLAADKRIQFTIYDDSVEGPDLDVGTTIDPADPASAVRAYISAAAASHLCKRCA